MQRLGLVAFALFAVCSFAQQTSSSQDSGIPIQAQGKPSVSQDSAKAEDQRDRDHEWHLRLGAVSVGAGYGWFSSPSYYPYSVYPLPPFYSSLLWDPYWGYFYPAGYFNHNDGKGE